MMDVLFSIAHVVLIVALILLIIVIKGIASEIDELRKELEHHRIKLKCLDDYTLLEYDRRLDRLEKAFELKEYFDGESLNE